MSRLIAAIGVMLLLAASASAEGTMTMGSELLEAALGGDIAAVRRLVSAGAPLEARDEAGRSPLLIAVRQQ